MIDSFIEKLSTTIESAIIFLAAAFIYFEFIKMIFKDNDLRLKSNSLSMTIAKIDLCMPHTNLFNFRIYGD